MAFRNTYMTSFIAIVWLVGFAAAQKSTATFAYPPQVTGTTPLLIINVVDTIIFQWTSNFNKQAFLWIFCDEGTPDNKKIYLWANYSVPISGNATYSPALKSDLNRDWRPNRPFNCHADLNYENVHNKNVNGPLFNITSIANRDATTYAAQYTTTGAPPDDNARITIASSTATTSSTSISTSTLTSSPPPSDSGLSTGATVGIAIGVVAGLGALAFLGFMVWRNKRKVDKLQSRIPDDNVDRYSKPQGVEVVQPYQDDVHQGAYAPITKYAHHGDNRQSMYGGDGVAAAPVELETLQSPQELPETGTQARSP